MFCTFEIPFKKVLLHLETCFDHEHRSPTFEGNSLILAWLLYALSHIFTVGMNCSTLSCIR
jgi:hypothetical protein